MKPLSRADEILLVAVLCLGDDAFSTTIREEVVRRAGEIRRTAGDRAVLRALHFHRDNRRVDDMITALRDNRIDDYLDLVRASGASSFQYLQNVYSPRHTREQGVALALALTDGLLAGQGAWRVHGGGFAGTIQAYIPSGTFASWKDLMENTFGDGTVTPLRIRSVPTAKLAL